MLPRHLARFDVPGLTVSAGLSPPHSMPSSSVAVSLTLLSLLDW